MLMPHQRRSPAALQGVIAAFVTREGTDDGTQDVSLATTVWQVRHQRGTGTTVLVSDADTERCTMQPTHALPDHG
jgi:uncharacterized protein YheU (UPF0270 family)